MKRPVLDGNDLVRQAQFHTFAKEHALTYERLAIVRELERLFESDISNDLVWAEPLTADEFVQVRAC